MKRFLLAIIILLSSIGLQAQDKECNRLFIHMKNKSKVYIMDRIDSLSFVNLSNTNNLMLYQSNGIFEKISLDNIDSLIFKNVEGKVAADVNIVDYTINSITLDITRTKSCVSFKMACLPYNSISYMKDDEIAEFINDNVSNAYSQNFSKAEITGLNLIPNTEYVIATVGIDEYNLLCDVVKAKFTTPSEDLLGNPKVEVTIIENNLYDCTLKFTPNSDVSRYWALIGEAGSIENQYKMFASSFGWGNMGDMIEDWGYNEYTKEEIIEYTDLNPNTVYEIYIQTRDKNDVRAPYKIFKFKTQSTGGEGIAKVDITLGEYTLEEWYNDEGNLEMLPSQFLTFTPNDQTSAYRFNVILATNYKDDVEGYQEDLCSDPFMPTIGWFQYEAITTDFQIDPNTSCVAIAAAKNINDEWGPVTELFFKTPSEMPSKTIKKRNIDIIPELKVLSK